MPLAKFVPNAQPLQAAQGQPETVLDKVQREESERASIPPDGKAGYASQPKYTGRKLQTDDKMTKEEWAAKDRRISRAGIYQAALHSMGAVQFNPEPTLEGYLATVRKIAEAGLQFVNEADK